MPGFELFGKEERDQVNEVLDTGILMRYNFDAQRKGIWKAKELEQNIQSKVGVKYAQLTSSGTTALITIMNAMGIGAGDEVILPAFTFVASFEAVLAVGAIPILVDIDKTMTLNPNAVEKAITPRTKAIVPVHMCGAMADLDLLLEIAKKHNLYILEDACQAIGGTYNGKYLGTIGDAGCFSFDFVKAVTCGEGGVVLTDNQEWFKKSDEYSDHGHDHIGNDRGAETHPFLGLNYRISELQAAVGVAQWNKLDEIIALQRRNHKAIKAELEQIKNIQFREIPDENGDSCSTISLIFPSEEIARRASEELKKEGVGGFYWYDNNWHYIRKWNHLKDMMTMAPLYKEHKDLLPNYSEQDFSVSDAVMSRVITFGISLSWTEQDSKERGNKMKTIISNLL
ncbi:MAG: DegT/DnrJ/EryC1/StrS family aminotransferase [Flavobacteriales bacterium]|nr:DegT/DnrJ/EryC1/StrS family aminotransferase [Flavobacteriales bacterium]